MNMDLKGLSLVSTNQTTRKIFVIFELKPDEKSSNHTEAQSQTKYKTQAYNYKHQWNIHLIYQLVDISYSLLSHI